MNTIHLTREFTFKINNELIALPDPGEHLTPQEVINYYSNQYPELTTATIKGPTPIDEKMVYHFDTVLGMKG